MFISLETSISKPTLLVLLVNTSLKLPVQGRTLRISRRDHLSCVQAAQTSLAINPLHELATRHRRSTATTYPDKIWQATPYHRARRFAIRLVAQKNKAAEAPVLLHFLRRTAHRVVNLQHCRQLSPYLSHCSHLPCH